MFVLLYRAAVISLFVYYYIRQRKSKNTAGSTRKVKINEIVIEEERQPHQSSNHKNEEEVIKKVNSFSPSNASSTSTVSIKSVESSSGELEKQTHSYSVSAKKSGYFEFDPNVHLYATPGMLDHLDLIQRTRLLILKEEPDCIDEFVLSDSNIWRYLCARKLDVEAAKKQALFSVRWRKGRKPDEIKLEEIKIEMETGKCSIRGKDKHGRPMMVLDNVKENTYDGYMNIQLLAYVMRRGIRLLEHPVAKYVVVIRLGETSMFNFSKLPAPSIVRETLRMFMSVYAEFLGHIILYQPPRIFALFLNLFRSMLDPHVMSKVVWITGDVSDGSANDVALRNLIGNHWKQIFGEGQPLYHPKNSPGYNTEADYQKCIQEEKEWEEKMKRAGISTSS